MEFLSTEFNTSTKSFPVNLVLQSAQSAAQGFSTTSSGDYKIVNLPFDPRTGFHEYRIDFVPGKVLFYADGQVLATMQTTVVPSMPGHLILTQWSNGNPLWSGGPPASDALMMVSYVKAYFNSSLQSRQHDLAGRCSNPVAPSAVCSIPDQTAAPDPGGLNGNVTANTHFFSNIQNSTNNQTVFRQNYGSRIWATGQFIHVVFVVFMFASISFLF
jgi:beta-glucanase (GH16 family)